MRYEETIKIEKEILDRVNGLLNIDELGIYTEEEKLLNPKTDDFIGLASVDFETEKHREQFPAYADCEVCEEWMCYQNFAEWWNKNMYHIGTERMHLDKDILIKGNKVYSPDTCLIVPQSINEIFHSSGKKKKDADLPHTIIRVARGRFSVSYRVNR